MKYSYEYKKQCVELYRQGKWPETPVGVNQKNFHKTIRKWARMEEACGPEVLHHKSQNKVWTAEENTNWLQEYWWEYQTKKLRLLLELMTASCINGSDAIK